MKLPAVFTTGPVTVTTPVDVPATLIAPLPTFPATQDTPAPSVPVWPFPDESAAIVPEPASNVQCAAGVGTAGMTTDRSLRDSSSSNMALARNCLRDRLSDLGKYLPRFITTTTHNFRPGV